MTFQEVPEITLTPTLCQNSEGSNESRGLQKSSEDPNILENLAGSKDQKSKESSSGPMDSNGSDNSMVLTLVPISCDVDLDSIDSTLPWLSTFKE